MLFHLKAKSFYLSENETDVHKMIDPNIVFNQKEEAEISLLTFCRYVAKLRVVRYEACRQAS